MINFKRSIQNDLEKWHKYSRNVALRLDGPPRVGKTTELLKFANSHYEQVIYVNLADDKYDFYETYCSSIFGMHEYCKKANLPEYKNNKDTILVIDSIELNKKLYQSLNSLNISLECRIAVIKNYEPRFSIKKYPFLYNLTMKSMSFSEFIEAIRECELKIDTRNLYKIYNKIGGYPEVVSEYIRSRSIDKCYKIIKSILNTFSLFVDDKEKYDQMCTVLVNITKNNIELMGAYNIFGTSLFVEVLPYLYESGMVHYGNLTPDNNIQESYSNAKAYFSDCGIASYLLGNAEDKVILNVLTNTFLENELMSIKDLRGCNTIAHMDENKITVVGENNLIYSVELISIERVNVHISNRLIGSRYKYEDDIEIPIYEVGYGFPYIGD